MIWYFVIGAAVIALIVKRFMGEPLAWRDLAIPPVVLTAIGIHHATDFTVLPLVVGFAFGALRGTTISVFEKDGHLWQRYTWKTVVVWAVSIGVGVLVAVLMGQPGPKTLSIGVGLLGELVTVGAKALNSGVPFAPEQRFSEKRGAS
jgi:hypothetical protein